MERSQRVHFVGIGGIGMSAIAAVLLDNGVAVSGSDLKLTPLTDKLEKHGATIFQGHTAKNVNNADLVVITSAVRTSNPEVAEAHRRGIPVIKRAEMLGRLMAERYGIAIAGTHGKTTTTSMVATILEQAGLSPTILVGGEIIGLESNAKNGTGKYLVAEADEYDGSFLQLSPSLGVITNIDADHLDFYKSMEGVMIAFRSFAQRIAPDGHLVVCADDKNIRTLIESPALPGLVTYGLNTPADWEARNLSPNELGGYNFHAFYHDDRVGHFELKVPGKHNVSNALAAIATASILDIAPASIAASLGSFRGAHRRFEVKGTANEVTVVDDYAHHPTEILTTLRAAKERFGQRRIVCLFQPHTYSRTKLLIKEFATCFGDADEVVIADIYAARETDDLGISSQHLVDAIIHSNVHWGGDLDSCLAYCLQSLKSGDVILTVGAGDVDRVGTDILKEFEQIAADSN